MKAYPFSGCESMTKFVFYTDVHLTAKTPCHRVDDYSAAILNKLRQVYAIAKQEDADFVLFGGDFYNSHRIFSYSLITEAMLTICGFDVPTFGVVGQHDLYGYNPTTYSKSTLAFQETHCLRFESLKKPLETDDAVIYPCHVYDDLFVCLQQRITKKKKTVLIAHQLISKEEFPFQTFRTCDLKTNFSLVLSGDLHNGFETHTINSTIYANPGSLARQSVRDINRIPKVFVVELTLGKPICIREVALDVPKGEDVFGTTFLEDVKANLVDKKVDVSDFVAQLETLRRDSVDIYDLVDKVCKGQGIRTEVRDYILSKKP